MYDKMAFTYCYKLLLAMAKYTISLRNNEGEHNGTITINAETAKQVNSTTITVNGAEIKFPKSVSLREG